MKTLTKEFILKTFPPVRFAYHSDYIIKSVRIRKPRVEPDIDLIFIVDNACDWNIQNFKRNKKHYPLIGKMFSYRVINFFQTRGAKIHFNNFKDGNGNNIQYGIVDYQDYKRDLLNWDSLVTSTYMQKPYDIIIQQNEDKDEIELLDYKNRLSALCFGILKIMPEKEGPFIVSERVLFKQIIKIPFLENLIFQLFQKYNYDENVEVLLEDFRKIYIPIARLSGHMQYQDGNFVIENNRLSRNYLLDNINVNLTLSRTQVRFHKWLSNKKYKLMLQHPIFYQIFRDLITSKPLRKSTIEPMQKSINKILLRSRFALIIMGKYFLFGLLIFKYVIKGAILYYLYQVKMDSSKQHENKPEAK